MAEDISTELSCYGHPGVKTPNLDQLSKEGTLYENAFTTAPSCTPARNAMLTGVYQTRTDTQDQRLLTPLRIKSEQLNFLLTMHHFSKMFDVDLPLPVVVFEVLSCVC